jgi:hypothetical protein
MITGRHLSVMKTLLLYEFVESEKLICADTRSDIEREKGHWILLRKAAVMLAFANGDSIADKMKYVLDIYFKSKSWHPLDSRCLWPANIFQTALINTVAKYLIPKENTTLAIEDWDNGWFTSSYSDDNMIQLSSLRIILDVVGAFYQFDDYFNESSAESPSIMWDLISKATTIPSEQQYDLKDEIDSILHVARYAGMHGGYLTLWNAE